MTHDEIAAQNTVERYILGKLPAGELSRFEEHFVDCPVCLDQLEDAERFRAALAPLAREAALPAARGAWQRWLRTAWPVAAALVLAAGLSVVLLKRESKLRLELEQARLASVDWQHRYVGARATGPLIGSTFYLNITRGADSDAVAPVNRVTASPDPHWVVLSLEGEIEPGWQSLRVRLQDAEGREVWQQSGLRASPRETLSVILPSAVLHGGDYVLTLEGLSPDGAYRPAGRYRFRAVTR